ncbi:CBS domain-containing protein [Mycobacterium sp. 663a-19]|uniref:CBS domain-containing protein n=1 Tax=Mycobacterium sp. 663a-19 TaxID=2986148 RepID=UPI002D1EE439|nr:CBS domain-containing protein [Mycobacterium sp. 663a-19]MEB3980026.1 CBS domain-containing protein [Mycobacterium sp. 663a-19]
MYPQDGTAASLAHVTAGDIMSSPVVTVPADASTQRVAETLTRHRISAAPVVNEAGALLGIVSEHDLLSKTGAVASDLMTTAVLSVTADSAADDIRHLLIDRRIRRVPVVQEGRLVGIVSRHDLVAAMATEWVCQVCGEPARGERPPGMCPRCHATGEQFVLQEQPPGT